MFLKLDTNMGVGRSGGESRGEMETTVIEQQSKKEKIKLLKTKNKKIHMNSIMLSISFSQFYCFPFNIVFKDLFT